MEIEEKSREYLFSNKDLRNLIIPLVLEQLLVITVGMADTMMVSSAGESAISGVSLIDVINVMINAIFSALATGGAVVISQCLGDNKTDDAKKSAKQLAYISVIFGFVIMVLVLIFKAWLLKIFYGSINQDVMENALTYLTIMAFSYPFVAAYQAGAAIFRSARNSQVTFKISILLNVINVIGNAICVLGLKMGVAGVAIPSFASYIIGTMIMYRMLGNKERLIYLEKEHIRIDTDIIKRILYIGVPNGVENGLQHIGRVLVVSIVSGFGTIEIAANGIANNIDTLGLLLGFAINLAMITVIGQCVGAHDEEQVRYYTKKILKVLYVSSAIFNIILLVFLDSILMIYQVSPETRELAKMLILIHNISAMLIWPTGFTLPNMLRACNDVTFSMIVAVVAMFAFRIGLGYILGVTMGCGSVGVWIAMVGDWIFRTVFYVYRYLSGRWKKYAGL